jgi:hypothetical protein
MAQRGKQMTAGAKALAKDGMHLQVGSLPIKLLA